MLHNMKFQTKQFNILGGVCVSGFHIIPYDHLFARRIMEMQVLIAELLGKFEFSPSEEGLELLHFWGVQTLDWTLMSLDFRGNSNTNSK